MKTYEAELFIKGTYQIAESPFYDERFKRLSWVDIVEGKLYSMTEDDKIDSVDFKQMIGAAVPMSDSEGFLVAGTDGLYIYESGVIDKIYDLTSEYKPYQRSNDAKMDPEGRLYFGSTVYDDEHPNQGNLYSYEDGVVTVRQANTRLANGMAWNKAGDKFYFSDSIEKKVFVYDYDRMTGEISNRNVLFTVTEGVPDGMCIDDNDNIWLAVWGGSRLELHDGVVGNELAKINVPAKQVSSCCFYGDSKRLFITTAGVGLDGELDGSLFTCEIEG
ncbi:MAG: SMP-30/gluconolactonase/LRE family protein [Lachnospiraceae bacterium]|nr:SMP-30/gluconolactonase/LRE family protein [Lachnospiraceae bacterium]